MKTPNEIFDELVSEVGLQRLAWERDQISAGRWYEDTDMIMELRRRLNKAGFSSVSDSLSEHLIEYACVRVVAERK